MLLFEAMYADPDLPEIDDRLAIPGERYEVIDGEWMYVAPADGPHGEAHADLAALVTLHTAPAFKVAVDMLTRTSKTNDIAPDVSIFPRARHPVSGRRQLEHVAFEIVSTQTLRHAGRKAVRLLGRGVRRVFAVDIERDRVLEWSTELDGWRMLASNDVIDDLVFAAPLPISAMLRAASLRPAIVRALIEQRDPDVEALRAEGIAAGKATSIVAILDARGIAVTGDERARILAERDADRLHRWLATAVVCSAAYELFG